MEWLAVTLRAIFCLSVLIEQICGTTSQTSTPPASQKSCFLPQSPEFGNYTAPICQFNNTLAECKQVPGTPVPQNWLLVFSCNDGYYFTDAKKDNFYVFCNGGDWIPKIPVCRMLHAEEATHVQVNTSHPSNSVLGTNHPFYKENETLCGKRKRNITSLGSTTQYNEFPWHVAVYKKNITDLWEQICLGTLISPHVVLTAAHCVYSENSKKILSPGDFKVGLGKYYREWTHDELFAVKSDVHEILIPPKYFGVTTSYSMDVALLDLPSSVYINEYIMPACVDWNRQFTVTHGMLGMLAGWDETQHGTSSNDLLYVELPYVDYHNCVSQVPSVFYHYITSDKFCAGTDGTDQLSRYSGGGLTFVHNDLYYVHGIVSTRLRSVNSLTTLTDISRREVADWIIEAKNILDKAHKQT